METIRVNMAPCDDVQTIHASQNDNEAREWGFELHNNGEKIDSSSITDQLVFKAYKGGTEQILPENGSTPTTSPFKGDIRYPQGLLTDQEFTYRESPTESDGLAKITDIKGNTLVWNQLVQNGNFASTSGWTVYQPANASINANSNVLTETLTISTLAQGNAYTIGLQKTNVISDATHKYLCFVTITLSFTSNVRIELGGWPVLGTNPINANTKTTLSVVSTAYTYNKNLLIYPQSGVVGIDLSGQTIKYENIMLIDLTLMFGAGNEPTAVDEFTSLFPLSYYPYDSGSLIPFMGNGIKTVGKNLVSLALSPARNPRLDGITIIEQSNESVTIKGDGATTYNCLGLFYALRKGTYQIKYQQRKNDELPANITLYSGSTNILNGVTPNTVRSFTLNGDATVEIRMFVSGNYTSTREVTFYNLQLEKGNSIGEYTPYTESLLNLPISTYFPTGMKSAGTVYDELTPRKAIVRAKTITLNGSESWRQGSPEQRFYLDDFVTDFKNNSNGKASNGWVVDPSSETAFSGDDKVLFQITGTTYRINLFANKLGITSTTNLITYLQNNPLTICYELATPTETSFTTASLVTENAEIPLSNEDGVLIGKCTEQLSAEPGFHDAKIKLSDGDGECYSNKIQLHVERSPQ